MVDRVPNPNPNLNEVLSFGINAISGEPIPAPEAESVAAMARGNPPGATAARRRQADSSHGVINFSVEASPDQDDLAQVGWAVIFAEADPRADDIEQALKPLLDRRASQAGTRYKLLKGSGGYQAGLDAVTWLNNRGMGLDIVDPNGPLPFYVMLIGDPSLIPMEFQYRLDIFWAVGRLDFENVADYAQYARSVMDHETAPKTGNGRFGLFAPRHDFDAATQLFHTTVVSGLKTTPLPNGFTLREVLAADATKNGYATLISGDEGAGTPQLVFTGGHGMEFPLGDARQVETQGALVCQDWVGYGAINSDAWFAASDVPDGALLAGTIHFIFACYGGGCSKIDTFREQGAAHLQISDADRTAALPRTLLLHKNGGALAVIAHVDRAFACSWYTRPAPASLHGNRQERRRLLAPAERGAKRAKPTCSCCE
jgi:hypothetical protein